MGNVWPYWDQSDLKSLVQYVTRAAIAPAGLQPPAGVVYNTPDTAAGRSIVGALYDSVRDRKITYGHEEWSPGLLQPVRPAQEMLQSKGTCVDIAVAFAAMCWEAQLRPLLALGGPDNARHVLVVVDLTATRNDSPLRPGHPLHPAANDPDLLTIQTLDRLPDHLLAVDITQATLQRAKPFQEALLIGERWVQDFGNDVHLVDVKYCRERELAGGAELPAPDPDWAPPIHTRMEPPAGRFTDYPSRGRARQELGAASGVIVLHGDSGMGKSLLAFHGKAATAVHGYGWMLTAADPRTLTTELAQAEFSETTEADGDTLFDRTIYKDKALLRLRTTRAPWVVVLDNADGDPSDQQRLIPLPGPGQTLVITTTNPLWLQGSAQDQDEDSVGDQPPQMDVPKYIHPAWAQGQPVLLVEVTHLAADEVDPRIPAWAATALAGNPQLLSTVSRALDSGGDLGGQRAITGPQLAWQTAIAALTADGCRDAARLFGWLPAAPVTPEQLAATGVIDALDVIRHLDRVGLVTADGDGNAQMHRLLRARALSDSRSSGDHVTAVLQAEGLWQWLVGGVDAELMQAYQTALNLAGSGRAWLSLARLHEYRGDVPEAGRLFDKALQHGGLTAVEQADCLQGKARRVKDSKDPSNDALIEARGWVAEIPEILDTSQPDQALRYQRARAIDGILLQKLANKNPDIALRQAGLLEARTIFEESLKERERLLAQLDDSLSDDYDRGLYNVAAVDMDLGKVTSGTESEGYFTKARDEYDQVLSARQSRWGDLSIPHIASCVAGLGMVDYNRVLRQIELSDTVDGAAAETLTAHLRDSTQETGLALVMRNQFEGTLDSGDDSQKSLDFLIKVLLMRKALAADARNPGSGRSASAVEKSMHAFWNEWSKLS